MAQQRYYKILICVAPFMAIILVGVILFIFFAKNGVEERDTKLPNSNTTKVTLELGIATWAGFGAGIVGMDRGFFPTINLKTKTLDDGRARQAAFVSGDLDIMISSIDLYAQESANGIQGKVILVTDESQGGDGIVAKVEIKNITDLLGKKIAYAHGGPSEYLLFKVLDDAGVKLEKVKRIAVDDPSRAGEVFLSGDVDAAVTWEPFLSNTAETGKGHILITTKEKPEIIVDILVANDKFANNEKLLCKFLDGWLKSVNFIKEHPDEAAGIMAKGLNLPMEEVQGMMTGLKFADRKRNSYFFDAVPPASTRLGKLFDEAGTYWKSVDIVKNPIDGATRISTTSARYFNSR